MNWISPLLQLVTIFLGLGYWRYQMISKRRYEVAEDALVVAGEVVAAFSYIRKAESDSLDPDVERREFKQDPYVLIQGRLQETGHTFTELDRVTKSITMHFGDAANEPFSELLSIYNEHCTAQTKLFRRSHADKLYEQAEKKALWDEWKNTIFQREADDPFAARIDAACAAAKKRYVPIMRPNFWRLFVPFLYAS